MSEIRANTLSDAAGTGPATLTKQSAAKAWVHGENDASLLNSFNISSSTDNGTGDYSYTFTNAFSGANYSACAIVRISSPTARTAMVSNQNTTDCNVKTTNASTSTYEDRRHMLSTHGDLA